jgi:organic hydroperoxide reductase OsmC/OhrA
MTVKPLPHHYDASACGRDHGFVSVRTSAVPEALRTAAPPEFGGPDACWTPESLLVAAVADCFVLSFRAAARANGLAWDTLDVGAEGVLDRKDGVTRFVSFVVRPRLHVPAGTSEEAALMALQRAKKMCLVTNSMLAPCELEPEVVAPQAA